METLFARLKNLLTTLFKPSNNCPIMAKFTVRIELHNAEKDTGVYSLLHQEMEKFGFHKTIVSKGKTYKLPDGEYNYSSDEKIKGILEKVKNITNKTKYKASILVTESKSRIWTNLEKEDEYLDFLDFEES